LVSKPSATTAESHDTPLTLVTGGALPSTALVPPFPGLRGITSPVHPKPPAVLHGPVPEALFSLRPFPILVKRVKSPPFSEWRSVPIVPEWASD
jgi:hypothetical protein